MGQILKHELSESEYPYLSMEYALVQSVYAYNECSFTLSKITDSFVTCQDIVHKARQKKSNLHEKLCLYLLTEIIRIVSQLHSINIIHSDLKLCSFLVKLSEPSLLCGDWSEQFGANGWNHFGLLLHDIEQCIRLEDFIDANEKNNTFGCCIDQSNLQNDTLCSTFQQLVKNKVWCYEVDIFAIFILIVQLLMHLDVGLSKGCEEVMRNLDFGQNIVAQIDAYRVKIGLDALQNGSMWNEILQMLLMREDESAAPYQFDKLSIGKRQTYLQQCHQHCSLQLMDLENLTPKLKVILARLDIMIRS